MIDSIGFDEIVEVLKANKDNNFLTGGGAKGWRASADWFFKPEHFAKVRAGAYKQRQVQAKCDFATTYTEDELNRLKQLYEQMQASPKPECRESKETQEPNLDKLIEQRKAEWAAMGITI